MVLMTEILIHHALRWKVVLSGEWLDSGEPCNSGVTEQKRITVKSERKRKGSGRPAHWPSACEETRASGVGDGTAAPV